MKPNIAEFSKFCRIDQRKSLNTTSKHSREMKHFFKWLGTRPVSVSVLRDYLATFEGKSAYTYKNCLSAFKIYFRDFLEEGWLVQSFKFPEKPVKILNAPDKRDLQTFFNAFNDIRDKAIFLLYATTGLRRNEVLQLQLDDIGFSKRMVIPQKNSKTKRTWITFYNAEAEMVLKSYLASRNDNKSKVFPISRNIFKAHWKNAQETTGLTLTPQRLRDWFCCEMGRLAVPDRYIDAFCGRVPRSILARHYTDYSPNRLKEIYDKADLKVLC